MEEWKDIPGYEGLYQISNKGRLKSLSKLIKKRRGSYISKEKILKNTKDKDGYIMATLYKNKNSKKKPVHRLVAENFLPREEGKGIVNHKDGNKANNDVENLEWCTAGENLIHALEAGLKYSNIVKFKKDIIRDYQENGMTAQKIAKKYGTSQTIVKRELMKEGIEFKGPEFWSKKYDLDKEQMLVDFQKKVSTIEMSKKHGISEALVCYYKNKWKKGELL